VGPWSGDEFMIIKEEREEGGCKSEESVRKG
jgi:hypothetical protein